MVPKASLKVGFFSRADRTRDDSMRCRILRAESRSTPHREATCDDEICYEAGQTRYRARHECNTYSHRGEGGGGARLTCTVTMASPVSRTKVLEKTLTTRPERKPTYMQGLITY